MEAKKISFGFSKTTKNPNLLPSKVNVKTDTKVELIKCLEGQEIKLVEEKPEEQPLIIPLKESQKTSAALASLMKRRAVLLGEEEILDNNSTNETKQSTAINRNEGDEDIEKRAARELLAELTMNDNTSPANNLVLPVVKPDELPLEGAKESTFDDYESIPIQDFGKAMLRGMGWTEPPKTNKNGSPLLDTPMVRPKGMGLGADKALNKKPLLVAPEANEVMEIKRNAYVRILGGKHKDLYGQIEGFDDHAGRIIVKMAIGGIKEAFNEFLCQPVCRKEYAQYGKCINTSKYEEYKKKENEYGQIILNKDEKNLIEDIKDEKKFKKERENFKEELCQENNVDYETERKNDDYQKDKRDTDNYREKFYISGNDRDKRNDCRGIFDKYDDKYHSRDENRSRRRENKDSSREATRDDERDHRREYSRDDGRDYKKEYKRNDEKDHGREYNRDVERNRYREDERQEPKSYEDDNYNDKRRYKDSRSDKRDSQKDHEHSSHHHDNWNYNKSSNRDGDIQKERDGGHHKLNDLSDCEGDSHLSKHKKSKKSKHSKKKSKKSHKSKSKYKSESSDTETSTSSDSPSDSEEEKRKKHKKKTKKSKKQRERSRSRGRK